MKKLIRVVVVAALLLVPVGYAQAKDATFSPDPQDFPAGNTFLYFPIAPNTGTFSFILVVANLAGSPAFITLDSLFLSGGGQASSFTANFAARDVQFHFPTSDGGVIVCPSPGCQILVHRPTFTFWSLLFVSDPSGGFSILTPFVFAT